MTMDSLSIARASRVISNQRHALEMILDVEVPHCPLHICEIEPNLPSILDVDPDIAPLRASWILLGAADRHVQAHDFVGDAVRVVTEPLLSATLGLGGTRGVLLSPSTSVIGS